MKRGILIVFSLLVTLAVAACIFLNHAFKSDYKMEFLPPGFVMAPEGGFDSVSYGTIFAMVYADTTKGESNKETAIRKFVTWVVENKDDDAKYEKVSDTSFKDIEGNVFSVETSVDSVIFKMNGNKLSEIKDTATQKAGDQPNK